MLEIEKKQNMRWRIMPLQDEKGNLIRESKPFRSDKKTREYIVCELFGHEIKDDEGDEIIAEAPDARVVKVVWEHRHQRTFNKIADKIEEGDLDKEGFVIGIKISGNHYRLPCDPYYVYDRDGQQIKRADGTPAIGEHVQFFLFANEADSVQQEYKRSTADLPYVKGTDSDDLEDEKDHEPPETEQQQQGSGRRRK